MSENIKKYSKHFSDDSFWEKVKKFGMKAGVSVIYTALLLYYTLQKPTTPAWAKTVIIGALGYFILPFDLIPDITPGIGYGDDLSALAGALLSVAMFIDEDVKAKAKERIVIWFGEAAMEEANKVDEKLNQKVNNESSEGAVN